MNSRVEVFIEQARRLNVSERIAALDALQELVTPPSPAWETAWAVESEERLAAYKRGELEAEDFDVVMTQLRQEFIAK
jgi:hypothetical protein